MADKQKDITSMIELIISNIDEFGYEFVTYKANSIKRLLEDTLEHIKAKEQALDEIENIIKGYCKNMCMAGTKETCDDCQNINTLNIINEVKEQ